MPSVARAQFSFPCQSTQRYELFSNAVRSKPSPSDYVQCKHAENWKPGISLNSEEKPAEAGYVSQIPVIIAKFELVSARIHYFSI